MRDRPRSRSLAPSQQQEPKPAHLRPSTLNGQKVLESAIRFATHAHRGQTDRQGLPVIFHVLRVMLAAESMAARTVAVLHDVIEDTEVSVSSLILEPFPDDVVEAVVAISRREDETYAAYVDRLAANPLAREVKLLDLADNMSRLHTLPHDEAVSLGRRYEIALLKLETLSSKRV